MFSMGHLGSVLSLLITVYQRCIRAHLWVYEMNNLMNRDTSFCLFGVLHTTWLKVSHDMTLLINQIWYLPSNKSRNCFCPLLWYYPHATKYELKLIKGGTSHKQLFLTIWKYAKYTPWTLYKHECPTLQV